MDEPKKETESDNKIESANDKSKKVAIYSTPTCTYCQMTKEFFKSNNVEYTDFDVSQDDTKREEMVEKSGQMGVPVVDINGEIIIGFDENKLRELLEL